MRVRDPGSVSVSVVTPVHDRRETTLAFLASLHAADREGIDLSVVVVDDGSTDGTAEAVGAEWPGVTLVPGDGSLWYTAGTNRGLAVALDEDPDYILACNDDLLFDHGCLRRLVDCAVAYPRTVVAPLLSPVGDPTRVMLAAPEWRVAAGGWLHAEDRTFDEAQEGPFLVDGLAGNCLLVPAAAFRECGVMDEIHLPHHGDAEFPSRLGRAGWRLAIEPAARAFSHPPRRWPRPAELSPREKWRHLVRDRRSGLNLRTRFFANRRVAPTALSATAASAVLLLRFALRAAGAKRAWPPRIRLPRLRERPSLAEEPASGPVDVVLSWPYVEWGGVQTYLAGIVRAGGPRVRCRAVISRESPPELLALLAESGIEVDTVDARVDLGTGGGLGVRFRRRFRNFLARGQFLRRLLAPETRSAAVHIDESFVPAFPYLFVLSAVRRVLITVHTPLEPPRRSVRGLVHRAETKLLARRARILAASTGAKRSLRRWLGRRALERVAVSPSGVDCDAASRAAGETRLQRRETPPLVVVSGRFIDRKGRWELLEAARLLRAKEVPFRIEWVSPDSPIASDLPRIAAFGLGETFRVVTPGEIGASRGDLMRFVARGDVFALPSREEGLPLALVEALALGLPCVATDVGAVREAVVPERTGLLVPACDPEALAQALERLLSDPLLRERMGTFASRFARRFDFSRTAVATLRAWDEIRTEA